jgi:hypothetical protein
MSLPLMLVCVALGTEDLDSVCLASFLIKEVSEADAFCFFEDGDSRNVLSSPAEHSFEPVGFFFGILLDSGVSCLFFGILKRSELLSYFFSGDLLSLLSSRRDGVLSSVTVVKVDRKASLVPALSSFSERCRFSRDSAEASSSPKSI